MKALIVIRIKALIDPLYTREREREREHWREREGQREAVFGVYRRMKETRKGALTEKFEIGRASCRERV